jgi:hypothetical protein
MNETRICVILTYVACLELECLRFLCSFITWQARPCYGLFPQRSKPTTCRKDWRISELMARLITSECLIREGRCIFMHCAGIRLWAPRRRGGGGHDYKGCRWACLLPRVYFIRVCMPVWVLVTIKWNKKYNLRKWRSVYFHERVFVVTAK